MLILAVLPTRLKKYFLFSRPVWLLSLVSLFADISSELLYPIMPLYLVSIGYGVGLIGILEGVAEATAGLSKIGFGRFSDRTGKRAVLVRTGYMLSTVSRPLILLSHMASWIILTRALDRLGKGLRTGARDAMLTEHSKPGQRGRVFGMHRSMDSIGAVLGPLLGLWWLSEHPGDYASMFIISLVPGLVSVGLTWVLPADIPAVTTRVKQLQINGFWKRAGVSYRSVAGGLIVFSLVNSADAFLLLRIRDLGYEPTQLIGFYILYNLSQSLLGLPIGTWADKMDKRVVLALGLLAFALVYGGMALGGNVWFIAGLLVVYGLYAALTDGVGKAALAEVIPTGEKATGMGFYQGLSSLAILVASLWTGFIWQSYGARLPLAVSAVVAVIAAMWFVYIARLESAEKTLSDPAAASL
jgi:MFS family permease